MRFSTIVPFIVQTPEGNIAFELGRVLELTEEQADLLAGKVEPLPQKREQAEAPRQREMEDHTAAPVVGIIRAGIVCDTPPHCRWCRSAGLWLTVQGDTRCRRCHPPAPGAEAVTGLGCETGH